MEPNIKPKIIFRFFFFFFILISFEINLLKFLGVYSRMNRDYFLFKIFHERKKSLGFGLGSFHHGTFF